MLTLKWRHRSLQIQVEMEEHNEEYQSLRIFTRNPDEKFSAKKLIEFFNEIHENEKNFIDGFSAAQNQGKT